MEDKKAHVISTSRREKAPNVKIKGEENKDVYFKTMQEWGPNVQNVHDSNLTEDVANSYKKIIRGLDFSGITDAEAIDEIRQSIDRLASEGDITRDQKLKANKTLNAMVRSTGVFSKIGSSEKKILSNIWRRIHIPENEDNRENMTVALVENMASSVERNGVAGSPVCMGGRVARVMSSLANMDHNPDVGVLKTKELVRNEVFSVAQQTYKTFMEDTIENGETESMRKGAEDCKEGHDTPESDAFEEVVKEKIEERLRNDYTELMSETDLNTLIGECQAAF